MDVRVTGGGSHYDAGRSAPTTGLPPAGEPGGEAEPGPGAGFVTAHATEARYAHWQEVASGERQQQELEKEHHPPVTGGPGDGRIGSVQTDSANLDAEQTAQAQADEQEAKQSSERHEAETTADHVKHGDAPTADQDQIRQADQVRHEAQKAQDLEHGINDLQNRVDALREDRNRLQEEVDQHPTDELRDALAKVQDTLKSTREKMDKQRAELGRLQDRVHSSNYKNARDFTAGHFEQAAEEAGLRGQELRDALGRAAGRIQEDVAYLDAGDKSSASVDLGAAGHDDLQVEEELRGLQRVIDFKAKPS